MDLDIKHIIRSHTFRMIIYIIVGLLVLLLVFQAGMFVGFKKASFSNKIGENYFREMNGKTDDPMMGLKGGDFENAHGTIGKIIGLQLPIVTVLDQDGVDKTIQIGTSTQIRGTNGIEKAGDLKVDDFVVVFGLPLSTDSILDAQLVRILPPPSSADQ